MPAPTPPNAQPDRCCRGPRSPVSSALTAIMKTRALAIPATSRSASQAAWFSVAPMSASVTTTRTRPARRASTDRVTAGLTMPSSAPAR